MNHQLVMENWRKFLVEYAIPPGTKLTPAQRRAYQRAFATKNKELAKQKIITDPNDPKYGSQYKSAHHAKNDPVFQKRAQEYYNKKKREWDALSPKEKRAEFVKAWNHSIGWVLTDLPEPDESMIEYLGWLAVEIVFVVFGFKWLYKLFVKKPLKWILQKAVDLIKPAFDKMVKGHFKSWEQVKGHMEKIKENPQSFQLSPQGA